MKQLHHKNLSSKLKVDQGNDAYDRPARSPHDNLMVLMQAIDTVEEVMDMIKEENENEVTIKEMPVEVIAGHDVHSQEAQVQNGIMSQDLVMWVNPQHGWSKRYTTWSKNITKIYCKELEPELVGAMKGQFFRMLSRTNLKKPWKHCELWEEAWKAIELNIWKPVHFNHLSADEKKLITPIMINYLP
jgi:hypothetical protein